MSTLILDQKADVDHVESVPPSDDKLGADDPALAKGVEAYTAVAGGIEFSEGRSPLEILRRNPKVFLLITIVMSTSIVTGMELSSQGNMPGSQAFCKVMGAYNPLAKAYLVDAYNVSLWTTGMIPGQLIGFFGSSIISEHLGRRVNLQFALLVLACGAVCEVCAPGWQVWLVSKFIMALANGLIQGGVATFAAEISPRELRGGAVIAYMTFNGIGNLLSTVMLYVCSMRWPSADEPLQYKVPLYVMVALPCLIFVLTLVFVPESPTYLVLKGKTAKAFGALERIYPYMGADEIELEMAKIQFTVDRELEYAHTHRNARWIDLFRGTDLRRTLVGTIPMLSYNLAGNILFLLSSYFFSVNGLSTSALESTLIIQCPAILFNLVAMVSVENKRVGRWLSLMIGMIILTVGQLLIGVVGSVWGADPGSSKSGTALLISAMVIANMGCQLGPQAVGYLYSAESGSARLRPKTIAFAQALAGVLGNLAGIYSPYMMDATTDLRWGCKAGYFFGGWGALFVVLCYYFVPDYTGRSYAQIDELYARRIPARQFAKTECTGTYVEGDDSPAAA